MDTCVILTVRTDTPGFGKASGAAWPCLLSLMVDLFICGLSDMINCLFAYVMFCMSFLAGLRLTGAACCR